MEDIFKAAYEADDFEEIHQLLDPVDEPKERTRGSRPGRAANINRDRRQGATRLFNDYLSLDPTYREHMFYRRFRVSRSIFFDIFDTLERNNSFFRLRKDATGLEGLNCYQKCTAALRQLAYGGSADAVDEYVRIGESTEMECLKMFASEVVNSYEDKYLSPPDAHQTKILLQRADMLGFPGMLGSIDCCKWTWKNCPTAYHGQYKGKEKVPTVTMKSIADDRLYIWHAFFGIAGCNNDLTVLDYSLLISKISNATYPLSCEYSVDGVNRNKPYWLSDGIYPKWPCFLHSILNHETDDDSYFAARQEGRRKDIERAFGVLQAKFHIISLPCRLWKKSIMQTIMYCCVILHNMVVEEKRPLIELREGTSSEIRVCDEVECCFVREQHRSARPIPGTITALSATNRYLYSASEYMNTRSLLFKKVVAERRVK